MVIALHGPPEQADRSRAEGRIDSVRGGIRTTFELVPDQPVIKLILKLRAATRA